MRTVSYQDVVNAVAELLGIDPTSELTPERARQWNTFINRRVKEAWRFWDWPDLRLTQERAFRPIWNASKQFVRAASGMNELFYIPTLSYYRVLADAASDPVPGTLPTDTDYYEALTAPDQYIDLDQSCRVAMGEVMGVYNSNPLTSGGVAAIGMPFRPSQRGIELQPNGIGGATAFVTFKIRPSQFTSEVYAAGTTYAKGAKVYYPTTGECYRALAATTGNLPTVAAFWAVIPFPERFKEFVSLAVASDACDDLQTGNKLLDQAYGELKGEVDSLIAQGDFHFYSLVDRTRRVFLPLGTSGFLWSISPVWPVSTVTTLTDECEDTGGGMAATVTQMLGAIYEPAIDGLYAADAGVTSALENYDTRSFETGSLLELIFTAPGDDEEARRSYKLKIGTADPADPRLQIVAFNSDATATARYWQLV